MQVDLVPPKHRQASGTPPHACAKNLTIGLVNLMPLLAMRRTELEFRTLLDLDNQGASVSLRSFAHLHVGRRSLAGPGSLVQPLDALWDVKLDGLIITGAEPHADAMADEPLLPVLRRLVEWSSTNTTSTIFSCFAAHAAVWCLDEIPRTRLTEKLSGVFTCQKSADHPLIAHLPDTWMTPHSRRNTLDEDALRNARYQVLSHARHRGPDMFRKPCANSEFLFVQGHPEYGTEVLQSEYLRDLKRLETGLTRHAPRRPDNYSDSENTWRDAAVQLMQGWKRLLIGRAGI